MSKSARKTYSEAFKKQVVTLRQGGKYVQIGQSRVRVSTPF